MSSEFARYLAPREIVRWSGAPEQGIVFRPADVALIPFSLMWCGFAVFWEFLAWRDGAPLFFMLWGAPFILIGIYFVAGRFIWDAFMRSKTKYALTDHRALILGGLSENELIDIDLRTTSEIRYKDHDGVRGTISFGPGLGPWRGGVWHSTTRHAPEFFRTAGASAAYRIIQAARTARE